MQPGKIENLNGSLQGIDFTALEMPTAGRGQTLKASPERSGLTSSVTRRKRSTAPLRTGLRTKRRLSAAWPSGLQRTVWKDQSAVLSATWSRFRKRGLLFDGRAEANKLKRAPVLSQADRDALVWWAIQPINTNIDGAWVKCVREKLISQELIDRYPFPKNRRPKCPKRIRSQIEAEVARLYPHRLGPRHARLTGADIRRDWSNVPSGAMYSSDDHTPDVYYYVPDGQDWFTIMRGQFLPVIDVRSRKILDFVLIDAPNYNALAIRRCSNRSDCGLGCLKSGTLSAACGKHPISWAGEDIREGARSLNWNRISRNGSVQGSCIPCQETRKRR